MFQPTCQIKTATAGSCSEFGLLISTDNQLNTYSYIVYPHASVHSAISGQCLSLSIITEIYPLCACLNRDQSTTNLNLSNKNVYGSPFGKSPERLQSRKGTLMKIKTNTKNNNFSVNLSCCIALSFIHLLGFTSQSLVLFLCATRLSRVLSPRSSISRSLEYLIRLQLALSSATGILIQTAHHNDWKPVHAGCAL